MTDVALEAGVSLPLTSLAFRNDYGVNAAARRRILATAERMNYQPDALAGRLASKVDHTIGVYLLDLHNEFFADIFDGMRESAMAANRELVVTIGSVEGELDRFAPWFSPASSSAHRSRQRASPVGHRI